MNREKEGEVHGESFAILNEAMNTTSYASIGAVFHLHSYIRLNKFFITPFSFITLKNGLKPHRLTSFEFFEGGLRIFFQSEVIEFKGSFDSHIKDGKIMYIKIDGLLNRGRSRGSSVYSTLIKYIKCFDVFYFMTVTVDVNFNTLSNPLVYNKYYLISLYRQYREEREGGSK